MQHTERSQDRSDYHHETVLRQEAASWIRPCAGGTVLDVTVGGGGHAEAVLESEPSCQFVGIDCDPAALAEASRRLARFGQRVRLIRGRFGDLVELTRELGLTRVDSILADLGVSSAQLAQADRGLSFRLQGPLDMRLDPSLARTARDAVSQCTQDELADLIYRFGEERRSRRVARCIKMALGAGELETTWDLRRAVVRAVGPSRVGGVDPATRTFQALRIAVNDELGQLDRLLQSAPLLLRPGGVLAIISFHSLEDRAVKRAFQDRWVWQALTKKPLTASAEEVRANPRARSAKLRVARRLDPDTSSCGPHDGRETAE